MKKTIVMLALATLMSVAAFGQNPPASGDTAKPAKAAPKKAKAKAKAKSETQPASTTPAPEKKGKAKN